MTSLTRQTNKQPTSFRFLHFQDVIIIIDDKDEDRRPTTQRRKQKIKCKDEEEEKEQVDGSGSVVIGRDDERVDDILWSVLR